MNSNPVNFPKELLPNYIGASNSVKECEDKEIWSSEQMYYVEGSYIVEVSDAMDDTGETQTIPRSDPRMVTDTFQWRQLHSNTIRGQLHLGCVEGLKSRK